MKVKIIMIVIVSIFATLMSILSSCSLPHDDNIWYDAEVVVQIEAYKIRNTNVPEFDLISLKNSEVQIICPHARYQIGDTIKFKQ